MAIVSMSVHQDLLKRSRPTLVTHVHPAVRNVLIQAHVMSVLIPSPTTNQISPVCLNVQMASSQISKVCVLPAIPHAALVLSLPPIALPVKEVMP